MKSEHKRLVTQMTNAELARWIIPKLDGYAGPAKGTDIAFLARMLAVVAIYALRSPRKRKDDDEQNMD